LTTLLPDTWSESCISSHAKVIGSHGLTLRITSGIENYSVIHQLTMVWWNFLRRSRSS